MAKKVVATRIRIISVPPGFPPDWVREFWFGVEIPLANPFSPESKGLQWNPRTGEITTGTSFDVITMQAMDALRQKSEEAYQWFVKNDIAGRYPVISFRSSNVILLP